MATKVRIVFILFRFWGSVVFDEIVLFRFWWCPLRSNWWVFSEKRGIVKVRWVHRHKSWSDWQPRILSTDLIDRCQVCPKHQPVIGPVVVLRRHIIREKRDADSGQFLPRQCWSNIIPDGIRIYITHNPPLPRITWGQGVGCRPNLCPPVVSIVRLVCEGRQGSIHRCHEDIITRCAVNVRFATFKALDNHICPRTPGWWSQRELKAATPKVDLPQTIGQT